MKGLSVVMLATDGLSTRAIYHALKSHCSIVGVLLEQNVSRWVFLRTRVRALGATTVVGQVLFQALLAPALRWAARRRRQGLIAAFEMCVDPIPEDVITRVRSANSSECVETMRKLAPQAVIVSGTRILSRDFISSVCCPVVNWHAGITPLYRGVHGGYWALVQRDRPHCGVTVHLVDEGIDTGAILFQAQVDLAASDNVTSYPLLQLGAAIPLLRKALGQVATGRIERLPGAGRAVASLESPNALAVFVVPAHLWCQVVLFDRLARCKKD